jgi:hypothetical protein
VALFALGASVLLAQVPAPPKPVKLGPLTVNVNWRVRLEAWDWFAGDAENTYAFPASLFRISVGRQQPRWDWQIELAAPSLFGLPADAIAPGAQGQLGFGATYFASNDRSRNPAHVFVRQAFVRAKRLGGSESTSLRLGRFEFVDGTEVAPKHATLAALKRDRIGHRLIGNFVFTHVGRSLDGIHLAYSGSKTNFTLLGARPTRGVFQVDGWGELDVALAYGAFTRQVPAAKGAGEARVFVLQYHDWRSVLKTDNRTLAARRADSSNIAITSIGGHYIHAFDAAPGAFDMLFWGAAQFGSWGALDHRAGALAVEGGFQPPLRILRPWIRLGYLYGSGDANPNDATHSTFFQVLPTARWYARFPFYNLMNSQDAFAHLTLRPHQKLAIRSEARWLRLASRADLWYQGGGAFQPWTFGYVGRPSGGAASFCTLFDVSADYQVNARLAATVYFGAAQGKSAIASTYPKGRNARLSYVEFTYRF